MHRPCVSTSTFAWSATSGIKRGTAPHQEGDLHHIPKKDRNSKKGISSPFGGKAPFPNKITPSANAQETSVDSYHNVLRFHATTAAVHNPTIIHIESQKPPLMLSAAIASLPTTCRPPFSLVTCATVSDRAYPYTHDLLELHNISSHSSFIPPIKDICSIVSPFQPAAWESALQDHPDRLLCNYIATGLRQGF